MDHLDDNLAAEFVSGSLPKSAVTRVEGHLARCRDCRTLVAALAADSGDSNAATVPHERLSPSQVAARPTRRLTVGDRVGRYLVLAPLGTGGMGVVFSAYDPQLDRKIAVKLLRAGLNYNTKEARTRLRREAQAIAQLSHPNVVGVYDVGETEDGDLYIAMEFVEGDTLTTWLKKYPRTWREIVDVFLQAARGLVAAHAVGLLHRDFKPDNVLVGGDGRVRVTDFGLARSVIAPEEVRPSAPSAGSSLNVDLTATGTVLGTPRYMAPEQLIGPDIDARADQFSFCVALYEALYGQHPLPGATSASMLEHGDAALPPPTETKVPPAVARAVVRGLDRDRSKRFPMMSALIAELVPRPARARGRYVATAAVVLLAGGAATAAVMLRRPPAEPLSAPDGVQPLIDKLNVYETERRQLLTKLAELTKERGAAHVELVELRSRLQEKDEEIQQLVTRVTELSARAAAPPAIKPVPQTMAVTRAVQQAANDLRGCFHEWSERAGSEADLVVTLVVDPSGQGGSAQVESGPESGFMRLCVAEAIARVKYPAGPDVLDVEVAVRWSAPDRVELAARAVKHQTLQDL